MSYPRRYPYSGKFPESKFAHRWFDGLKGVEIGGSAHNSFGLDTINVDYTDEFTAHKQAEVDICGEMLPVDVVAHGDNLPFDDSQFDFLVNSHVIEHMPDTIRAVLEWHRVVKPNGLILFNVPNRDDNAEDARHPYTSMQHVFRDLILRYDYDTHPFPAGFSKYGHMHFWDITRFAEMIEVFFGDSLPIVDSLQKDDKVGNGFMVLCRVLKHDFKFLEDMRRHYNG